MQTLERLTAGDLAAAVTAYRTRCVPTRRRSTASTSIRSDGDTGTNMALTVESMVRELAERGDRADMPMVAEAISYGSLMGARGNSGVILAQIFRGLADAVRDTAGSTAAGWRTGWLEPLTGRTRRLSTRRRDHPDVPVLAPPTPQARSRRVPAWRRRSRPPVWAQAWPWPDTDLLPVLKAAGVVDSGGAGFVLLFVVLLHVADGPPSRNVRRALGGRTDAAPANVASGPGQAAAAIPPDCAMRSCTSWKPPDESIPPFRRCAPDWAIRSWSSAEAACEFSHPHRHQIARGHRSGESRPACPGASGPSTRGRRSRRSGGYERRAVHHPNLSPSSNRPVGGGRRSAPAVPRRIFRSLGVHHAVSGGQSMNPLMAQLLVAIEVPPARRWPPAKQQEHCPGGRAGCPHFAKRVRVIPTAGIQEGFGAALLEHDPEGANDPYALLTPPPGLEGRKPAQVTQAARPSVCDAGPIEEGDYLGLSLRGIQAVAPDLSEAANQLLE